MVFVFIALFWLSFFVYGNREVDVAAFLAQLCTKPILSPRSQRDVPTIFHVQLDGAEEAEYIVAKSIRDGVIDAVIVRIERLLFCSLLVALSLMFGVPILSSR